jgi:hypothetical protein
VDTEAVARTREEELQDSLVGCTVEEVKLLDTTGGSLALVRLSRAGAEDAFACFDATSFADADSIWHQLSAR